MENNLSSKDAPQAHKSESLTEQAMSVGSRLWHAAGQEIQQGEQYIKEHPKLSAVVGVTAVAAAGALAFATRGKSAEIETIAEEALASSAKSAPSLSRLAGEAASMMRDSSTLRKIAAFTPIVPLLALTGCDDDKKEKVDIYKDAVQCTEAGVFTRGYCESEYAAAKQLHDETAPKFANQKECQDKTGDQCKADDQLATSTSHGGAVIYRPWMYGYTMSRGSSDDSGTGSLSSRSTPIYSETGSGQLVTSHGEDLGTKTTGVETEVSESTLSRASKPGSSGDSGESTEAGSFSRSSSAGGGEGEGEGVSRGGFGGGGEGGEGVGGHGGGVGE